MSLPLFKRNLARCGKLITLQNRDIAPPDFGSPDFDETFTNTLEDVRAILQTKRGKVLFDGVSIDQNVTHRICLEFVAGVTSETWVLYNGRRFDILDVENVGEQGQCLILLCNERGVGEAAKA